MEVLLSMEVVFVSALQWKYHEKNMDLVHYESHMIIMKISYISFYICKLLWHF